MQLGSARIGASSGSGFSRQLAGATATLALGAKPQGQPRNGRQPFKGGRCLTTSQGGDAMDIDTMEATDINGIGFNQITKEEEAKLRAKNACFYCQKPGHRANDCYKKKRDCAQAGGSGRN